MIANLPSELIIQILDNLTLRDVLRCQTVSKQFKQLIQSSLRLQYAIELAVAGYDDRCIGTSLSSEEKHALLMAHQRSWKNPSLSSVKLLELPRDHEFMYRKFSQGLFLSISADPNIPGPGFNAIGVLDLTRAREATPSWAIRTNYCFSTEFAVDPSQDLLVLPHVARDQGSTFNVSVLSLKHGSCHPKATSEVLRIGFEDWSMPFCTQVQIAGHLVVLMVAAQRYSNGVEIVVIDWVSGNVKLRLSHSLPNRVYHDSSLLMIYGGLLVATGMEREPCRLPVVDVYALGHLVSPHSTNPISTDPDPIAIYELPCPRPEHVIRVRVGHTSSCWKTSVEDDMNPTHAPFTVPLHKSLFVITLHIFENVIIGDREARRPHSFDIVTPISTLVPPSVLKNPSPRRGRYSWSAWGPRSTRWFEDHTFGANMACGYRIFTLERVLDFNPLDVRRDRFSWDRDNASDGQSQIITDETVFPRDTIFMEDVHSSLPYRTTPLQLPAYVDCLWACKDLIGFTADENQVKLHVFGGLSLPPTIPIDWNARTETFE